MDAYLSRLPIQVYIHDYEIDLGSPEYLVPVQIGVTPPASLRTSYEHFVFILNTALDKVGGAVTDLETKQSFKAWFSSNRGLTIEAQGLSALLDHDELRGVWASLQKGLLTRHSAAWFAGESASRLLSIVSLLPEVRAVQVQRFSEVEPEIAWNFGGINR